jgi:hypothetical protein
LLDENVKINAKLHKVTAERLYDLRLLALRKPDVVGITSTTQGKEVEDSPKKCGFFGRSDQ